MDSVLFWNFILQQLKKNWEYAVEWLSLENLSSYILKAPKLPNLPISKLHNSYDICPDHTIL